MMLSEVVCRGEFLAPHVEATTRICTRCAAELDQDDERLARGLGQHRRMPTVPRGDVPDHLVERVGRIRIPISSGPSVPKHDPMRVYADIELNLWERVCVLIWGRVVVETLVEGVVPVQHPVTMRSMASVPTLSGRLAEPVALQAVLGMSPPAVGGSYNT